MESKPTVKIKTMTYYLKHKKQKLILDFMTKISKNIYNTTLFIYKIYKIFQNNIYEEVYNYVIKNKLETYFLNLPKTNENKEDNDIKKEKHPNLLKIEIFFYETFDKYYKFFISNKTIIDSNNKIIYNYIIRNIKDNNIIVSNNNYNLLTHKYINDVIKLDNINYTELNKLITVDNIVKSIIKSLYCKNYFFVEKLKKNNFNVDIKYNDVVNTINNKQYVYDDGNENYRNMLINDLNIKNLSSIENFISRLTYKYIGENKEKIPSDVIINIITKAYSNIKSYYKLLKSGKQANVNMCKFLDKDVKFNLFYYCRSFLILDDGIRLNVGKYINDNFNEITGNNYKSITIKNNVKYYNENNLLDLSKNTLKKKRKTGIKYQKINNKYINNNHLINYNYIYLPLLRKIEFEKIKLIEIKPENKNIKVCINYEKVYEYELTNYDIEKYNKLSLNEKLEKTISMDTGTINLLTIYNPTGIQQIIKGGTIKSINNFYNKKIDKLNSINKKEHDKNDYGRLHSLLKERENKINGYINKIIDTLIEEYKEKEVFIIGYNPNWKNKVNMGRKNNRNFYMIPYKRIIERLDEKLKNINKKLLIIKESYTSICDALALEDIKYHEKYLGKRTKRGLFKSSKGKLLNADINGAINIMRKKIELKEITGKKILNPKIIKIYDVMRKPASKNTSHKYVVFN
jgi:IS605 OrfB family transposase